MNDSILTVKDVVKGFRQGNTDIPVLRKVNFSLARGTTLAIVGKSGSGKSTLLSLIAGLDSPDSGSIQLSGTDMNSMSEKDLTQFRGREIGIVFQQFHLLPNLTAIENVSLPLEIQGLKKTRGTAESALEKVGLSKRINHFPHQLSGGEKQRVAIARSIIHKPRLLLADEPSGNLDNETGETVMEILFNLVTSQEMSMVLVTHSLEFASSCSEVLNLKKGVLSPHV